MPTIQFTLNQRTVKVDVAEEMPLLWVLRDKLGLTGTKYGCGALQCGACTVHVDGQPMRTCQLPVKAVADKEVTTIEGIAQAEDGAAMGPLQYGRALQEAWVVEQVPQCGYCQSGQIMVASALLSQHPQPSDEQIDQAMRGNVCRCGTYQRIRRAIHRAAQSQAPSERPQPALAPQANPNTQAVEEG